MGEKEENFHLDISLSSGRFLKSQVYFLLGLVLLILIYLLYLKHAMFLF